jgi:hypothetical protein
MLAEAPNNMLAEAPPSRGLAEAGLDISRPVDPDIFFDRVGAGEVWKKRGLWGLGIVGGVAVAGSIAQGNMQGDDEQLNNRRPTMLGGQGMQGTRF